MENENIQHQHHQSKDLGNLQKSQGRRAVVSLMTSDYYLDGARVLGHTLRELQNIPDDVEMLLLYPPEKLSSKTLCYLENTPWILKPIKLIPTPPDPQGRQPLDSFADMFTKLAVWNMTEYDALLYLDLDTIATAPLHAIFDMNVDFAAVSLWNSSARMRLFDHLL